MEKPCSSGSEELRYRWSLPVPLVSGAESEKGPAWLL